MIEREQFCDFHWFNHDPLQDKFTIQSGLVNVLLRWFEIGIYEFNLNLRDHVTSAY